MRRTAFVIAAFLLLFAACGDDRGTPTSPMPNPTPTPEPQPSPTPQPTPTPSPTPSPQPVADAVLIGAGDIARCKPDGSGAVAEAEETARILDRNPGTVFTLGDHAYPANEQGFKNCYDPTWGRHKARTRPSMGNHENEDTRNAPWPFFTYFSAQLAEVGAQPDGYYAYLAGAWQVVVLNSEVPISEGSAQWLWLKTQLARNPTQCALAYWHRPLFANGPNGSSLDLRPAWNLLYEAGAEVALNGHEHFYERSAPQTPSGSLDRQRGIRQFIVGTGGAVPYAFRPGPNSESGATVNGVLKLNLRTGSYDWEFIPITGASFRDFGTGICH